MDMYETLKIEIISFEAEDIICASGPDGEGEDF